MIYNTYLITYELILPSLAVQANVINNTIKSFAYWAKPTSNVWLIKTTFSREYVMSKLRNSAGPNDKILVMRVTSDWISVNLSEKVIKWMKSGL